jgi:hypothetical protein
MAREFPVPGSGLANHEKGKPIRLAANIFSARVNKEIRISHITVRFGSGACLTTMNHELGTGNRELSRHDRAVPGVEFCRLKTDYDYADFGIVDSLTRSA